MDMLLPLPILLVDIGVIAFCVALLLWWRLHHKRSFATMFLRGGLLAIAAWALGLVLFLVRPVAVKALPASPLALPLLMLAFMVLGAGATYLIILAGALFIPLRRASWEQAVAAGLSYGGIGSVIVVSHSLLVQSRLLTFPSRVELGYSRRILVGAIISRLSLVPAIAFEALAFLLIIHAVQTKSWKWFALGFVWLLARPGVGYLFAVLPMPVRYLEVNLAVIALVLGLIGLWGLHAMRRHWQLPSSDEGAA